MNAKEFETLLQHLQTLETNVIRDKSDAYTGDGNRFRNFEEMSSMSGQHVNQIMLTFLLKHIQCIAKAISDDPTNPIEKSEGMVGRVVDARNYLALILAYNNQNYNIENKVLTGKDYYPPLYELKVNESYEDVLLAKAREVFDKKGRAYAGTCKAGTNFEEIGDLLNIKPIQVWGAYFIKHLYALKSAVNNNGIEITEGFEGRIIDAFNYAVLAIWQTLPDPTHDNLLKFFDETCEKILKSSKVLNENWVSSHEEVIDELFRCTYTLMVTEKPEQRANIINKILKLILALYAQY